MAEDEKSRITFSVDTHLFRELGELLVGRESTALIELVKNAYDADATEVSVSGENLGDPNRGVIRIRDNGVGMDPDTFEKGFLRIAARIKSDGSRRSATWGRRYTGAKGVGRLSAHKLARKMEIQSTPWVASEDVARHEIIGVDGSIDWDMVEKAETLDDIEDGAVVATPTPVRTSQAHGTTLLLTRLRQKWTVQQRGRFLTEVEALRAPQVISGTLPENVLPSVGLFEAPTVRDTHGNDPGFTVDLLGDFQVGESYWPAVLEAGAWLLEIDASREEVRYFVAPTKKTRRENPLAREHRLSEKHPSPETGPFFHARVLIRTGTAGKKDERAWAARVGGVRVYVEGFRVLPYGEENDDWLSLGRDTNDRSRKLRFLAGSSFDEVEEVPEEGLLLLPNKHYLGGVFLTASGAGSLQMLVNREGFVPDITFETLVALVRRGIDLSTRVRAALNAVTPEDEPLSEPRNSVRPTPSTSSKGNAEGSLSRLTEQAVELGKIAAEAPDDLARKLRKAVAEISYAAEVSRKTIPANSMVLVLASVGTQLAAFTHEVNRLLGLAADLESSITRLADEDLPPKFKARVTKVSRAAADLRRAIERQAAYLVDIVTPDARRRRTRLKVEDSLTAAWKFVATSAEQRRVALQIEVDADLRTPPMFRAELIAIFTNLLTNAVKAAGNDGTVRVTAETDAERALRIRVENTGVKVDLDQAERWFRPFESTTINVDPVLGQGMGLGLGITRDLLADAGATVAFVRPHRGYATALEIRFQGDGQ